MIGVSQSHMHNILKGIRKLSPVVADRILATLEISLLDLVAQGQTPLGGLPSMAPPEAPSRAPSDEPGPLPGRSPAPGGRSAPN
ncbi:MAG: helix-turn-helix domain-containing protein [Bryobacteraceae bacterium]